MSHCIIANRRLTDILQINAPVILSSGPGVRQFGGRLTSQSHNCLLRSKTLLPMTVNRTSGRRSPKQEPQSGAGL
jgi:hypothetical protein